MGVRWLALACGVVFVGGVVGAVTVDPDDGPDTGSACLAGGPYTDEPDRIVDALLAGHFVDAREHFDDTMQQELDADRIESAWRSVTKPLGTCQTRKPVEPVVRSGFTIADVPLEFERGRIDVRVTLADDARVSGLFLLPGATSTAIPATPAGSQLRFALDVIDGKVALDDATIRQRFSPSFLSSVPPERLRATTDRLVAASPWRMQCVAGSSTPTSLQAGVRGFYGAPARIELTVDPLPPHRINGLLVSPTLRPCPSAG